MENFKLTRNPKALWLNSLIAFSINIPESPDDNGDNTLELVGWVLGKNCPASTVEIKQGEKVIQEIPINKLRPKLSTLYPNISYAAKSGFKCEFNIRELPPECKLDVAVVLEDNTQVIIGKIQPKIKTNMTSKIRNVDCPIFIFGCVRTGSSMLVNLLRAHGYKGDGEGHLLSVFKEISDTINNFYAKKEKQNLIIKGVTIEGINCERILEPIYNIAAELMNDRYKSNFWFEKTVSLQSLSAIDIYKKIWPGAKFIFTKRRPIEIIISMKIKFPKNSVEKNCKTIKMIFETWSIIKKSLPSTDYIELEQYNAVINPKAYIKSIKQVLNENFFISEQFIQDFISQKFPQRSSRTYEPISFESLDWSKEEKQLFVENLDNVMQIYKYSYDTKYYLD